MRLHRAPLLLTAIALLAATTAVAEAPADRPDCPRPIAFEEPLLTPAVTMTAAPVFLADGTKGEGAPSSLNPSPRGENLAQACEWFDISCSNGTTDECCGSVKSCGVYCGEVCGEPCVYNPE